MPGFVIKSKLGSLQFLQDPMKTKNLLLPGVGPWISIKCLDSSIPIWPNGIIFHLHLDFPEIRRIPLVNHHLGEIGLKSVVWGREVIWPDSSPQSGRPSSFRVPSASSASWHPRHAWSAPECLGWPWPVKQKMNVKVTRGHVDVPSETRYHVVTTWTEIYLCVWVNLYQEYSFCCTYNSKGLHPVGFGGLGLHNLPLATVC